MLIGGHIDSVPNGGWLDGCLNVVAGVEVLRRIAEEGTPPVTVRLVNWADEEGARFGRSLFGSSAAAGSMADQDELRAARRPRRRRAARRARARTASTSTARSRRASQLENAAAYLELHIEQGPVLESLDLPLGVVLGTFGVERHRITWRGQAAHAGSTPMDKRRDALAGAAKLALEIREIADADRRRRGLHVAAASSASPGSSPRSSRRPSSCSTSATSTPASSPRCSRDAKERVASASPRRRTSRSSGSGSGRSSRSSSTTTLIELADEAIREVAGTSHRLPSGPLHDAAEVSRAGVPTVMLFVQSLRGLSHTKLEDTKPEHLELVRRGARPARVEDASQSSPASRSGRRRLCRAKPGFAHRLTTLAAGACARSPSPYHSYCLGPARLSPLRPSPQNA